MTIDDGPDQSGRWPTHRLPGFDYSNPDHAYFVTIRARTGTAPFADPRVARLVIDSLHWLRNNRGVVILAYCLMTDHLHVLLRLPADSRPLGEIIGAVKSFTTRESWKLGREGALWQGLFHDHVVRQREDGEAIAAYILANPVRGGLVRNPEEYEWSGTPDPL